MIIGNEIDNSSAKGTGYTCIIRCVYIMNCSYMSCIYKYVMLYMMFVASLYYDKTCLHDMSSLI